MDDASGDDGTGASGGEPADGGEPPGDGTGEAGETGEPAERVAELERTVERLRERVETQQEALSILVAHADLEALPPAECPYCGEGTLSTEGGLSWQRIACDSCGMQQYL